MTRAQSLQKTIQFSKMHGIGNDFVILDQWRQPPGFELTPELARILGNRKSGVGCDQLLWLKAPLETANHARMEIRNADGSEASMCGNGIRAIAKYLFESGPDGLRGLSTYKIETLSGIKVIQVLPGDLYRVEMGVPEKIKSEHLEGYDFDLIDVGNLHAVAFVPQVSHVEIERLGPRVEHSNLWPKSANVEWVEVHPKRLKTRVWESGVGETRACGTGACAVAVAHFLKGPDAERLGETTRSSLRADGVRVMLVELPGGNLEIEWAGPGTQVIMTGPATRVYQGEFLLP